MSMFLSPIWLWVTDLPTVLGSLTWLICCCHQHLGIWSLQRKLSQIKWRYFEVWGKKSKWLCGILLMTQSIQFIFKALKNGEKKNCQSFSKGVSCQHLTILLYYFSVHGKLLPNFAQEIYIVFNVAVNVTLHPSMLDTVKTFWTFHAVFYCCSYVLLDLSLESLVLGYQGIGDRAHMVRKTIRVKSASLHIPAVSPKQVLIRLYLDSGKWSTPGKDPTSFSCRQIYSFEKET